MPSGLDRINGLDRDTLTATLLACCDVPNWAAALSDGRPYTDADTLLQAADLAARRFTEADVERAVAAHPRIGERAGGPGTAAAWSRQEQAGVSGDGPAGRELLEGNRAYEARFGRVFLICATGLSEAQILAALRERLTHSDATESAVVADELRKIALLRLGKVIES